VGVHLVRHGCAGDKREWSGPDAERPLDDAGVRQAAALADLLGGRPIRRIVSSPTARCHQTVEPLARRLGLPVEADDALRPEATRAELDRLLTDVRATTPDDADTVLCTHGELMRPLLADLRRAGLPLAPDDDHLLAKGTGWHLTFDAAGHVTALDHIVPAATPGCPTHPRP
jgi:broad specificity phosphatase PhoE